MALKVLTLQTLGDLDDGKIAAALDVHLEHATRDCYDRPGDPKARKVGLEVLIVPVLDDQGSCTEAKVQVKVYDAVPKRQSRVLSFGLRPNGKLIFNPDSPTAVDQGTFLHPESEED